MSPDELERSALKEQRESQRVPAEAPATILSTAVGRIGVTVVDLSRTGCRIRTRLRCRRGDTFVLRIGALGPKAVTAAWTADGEVGLTFAEPLAWSVVMAVAGGASPPA